MDGPAHLTPELPAGDGNLHLGAADVHRNAHIHTHPNADGNVYSHAHRYGHIDCPVKRGCLGYRLGGIMKLEVWLSAMLPDSCFDRLSWR